MFIVLVQTIETTEVVRVFGPFRSKDRAEDIRALCRNPYAVEYYDYDDHMITVLPLRRYGD